MVHLKGISPLRYASVEMTGEKGSVLVKIGDVQVACFLID
jgi:hypothetical protein